MGNRVFYDHEGLNTVKYDLVETQETKLYTKFLIYYDQDAYMKNVTVDVATKHP
jgi:hypothetical protein